ncbi:oligosaccharyl transferase beta subunit [Pluteus cervinus]|uniref:Oligosaccharyl transferase beta subunit n=1 Tax=Pluteus cervinus TaxID=181527 RepID=A0ACD3AVS2_9AGAR|nr:oligosaccharyl transferase beta subunit [Pluteus cervinus]
MMLLSSLVLLLSGVISGTLAKSSTGNTVLVVVETAKQSNYSKFFKGLENKGFDLTFREPKAESPVIIQDDVPSFSHVIVLASDAKNFAKDITPQTLIELTTLKTNLLIALSPKQTPLSSLAAEFSLILPTPGSVLYSYFPERADKPTVVPVNIPQTPITSQKGPVFFSGVPFALGDNPLLVPILNAPVEGFAAESTSAEVLVEAADRGGEGLWAGSRLGLVTGFQTLDGARVTWVGGPEVFSDEYAAKEGPNGVKAANAQFVQDVAAWTFQESLVLRVDKVNHFLANTTTSLEQYTTNDNIEFSAYISAYDAKTGTWAPYSGITDMQLEFTMLDPHIRTALLPVPGVPGKYSKTFRAPDRHGVFKFVINYKRKGYSYLQSSTIVPVVPPRHDGYPRFLSAAWPYYAGAISTSLGFFVFSALWLAGDSRPAKKGKAQKTE